MPMAGASTVSAATGNRAAALLIDLLALGVLPFQLLRSYFAEGPLQIALVLLFFVNRAGLPATTLQASLGQWACRIRLVSLDGKPIPWVAAMVRTGAFALWFLCLYFLVPKDGPANLLHIFLFPLPWLFIVLTSRSQSLFDLAAGTLAVWRSASAQEIARVRAPFTRGQWFRRGAGALLSCLLAAYVLSIPLDMSYQRGILDRIGYAYQETEKLRETLARFHVSAQRWPRSSEMAGLARHRYPAGGGYQLMEQGRIRIHFEVLQGIRGRSIDVDPVRSAEGLRWRCRWTDGQAYSDLLPRSCSQ